MTQVKLFRVEICPNVEERGEDGFLENAPCAGQLPCMAAAKYIMGVRLAGTEQVYCERQPGVSEVSDPYYDDPDLW